MKELTLAQELSAKSLATEVVLLALMREKREDAAFWNSLDKLMAIVLNLDDLAAHPAPEVRAMAESAQSFLDHWRQIAGKDPNAPAPLGSLPFDPPPVG